MLRKLLFWIVWLLIIIGVSCSDEDSIVVKQTEGITDANIPFDALGSGKLLFTRDFDDREGGAFLIDIDKRSTRGLELEGYGYLRESTISPDGNHIVYSLRDSENQYEVQLISIDGSNPTNLSNSPWDCTNPSWTPDSDHILYQEYASGNSRNLFKINIETSERELLKVFSHGDVFDSRISVSGSGIFLFAFTTYKETGLPFAGIFTMENAYGDPVQLLEAPPHSSQSPMWSPDGNRIAFFESDWHDSGPVGFWIKICDGNGENMTTVSHFPVSGEFEFGYISLASGRSLVWSPDGTKIAFDWMDGSGRHIYLINADGTGLTQITSEPGATDHYLSWSN